jgi:ferritin-like metal-binding protein YciE
MKNNTLRRLFIDELRDLYDAENRLVKALPKLAKAAESDELRSGFEEHLEQTKGHVERLKKVLTSLGEKANGKKCAGIMGIIDEGAEMMEEDFEGAVMDAALISAGQRAEHYEIAAYGCVHAWAKILGENDAAEILAKTLEEEKETDEKLSELAGKINKQANSSPSELEGRDEEELREEDEEIIVSKPRSRTARA